METEENNYVMESASNSSFNGLPCVPWEVEYVPGTGTGVSNLNTVCETVNPIMYPSNPECAILTCKVEGLFVLNLLSLVGLDDGIDARFHVESGFDHDSNCPTVVGMGGDDTRACCGSYPYRRPFHVRNGANGCCSNGDDFVKVFQVLTHVCCADRVVENGDVC